MVSLDTWFEQALERLKQKDTSLNEEIMLRAFYFYQKSLCATDNCFSENWREKYLEYVRNNFQSKEV